MNFKDKWINWLKAIFESARPSILINGSPTKEFNMERGLRQGDPLSPLLFNLVGEMLHKLLESATKSGIFEGINLNNNYNISHLQFADDTILFIKDDVQSIRGIKVVLKIFEIMSGLQINFSKSYVYGSSANQANLQLWANILECNVGTWPLKYLGASIGKS